MAASPLLLVDPRRGTLLASAKEHLHSLHAAVTHVILFAITSACFFLPCPFSLLHSLVSHLFNTPSREAAFSIRVMTQPETAPSLTILARRQDHALSLSNEPFHPKFSIPTKPKPPDISPTISLQLVFSFIQNRHGNTILRSKERSPWVPISRPVAHDRASSFHPTIATNSTPANSAANGTHIFHCNVNTTGREAVSARRACLTVTIGTFRPLAVYLRTTILLANLMAECGNYSYPPL